MSHGFFSFVSVGRTVGFRALDRIPRRYREGKRTRVLHNAGHLEVVLCAKHGRPGNGRSVEPGGAATLARICPTKKGEASERSASTALAT
jgi:hypothetical protein